MAGFADPSKDHALRRMLLKQLLKWEDDEAQATGGGPSEEARAIAEKLGFPLEGNVDDLPKEIDYSEEAIKKALFRIERCPEDSHEFKEASDYLIDAFEKGFIKKDSEKK
jgi:hypothetical protein